MLKKSDLSKQFELVVQQEIKNYQDSLNFVLQSIRELKESIEDGRSESLKNHGFTCSLYNFLKTDIANLKVDWGDISKKLDSFLSDQDDVNDKNSVEIRDIKNTVLSQINIFKNFYQKFDDFDREINNLKKSVDGHKRVFNDNLDDQARKFREDMNRLKQEIVESPSEISQVKEYLENKISCHRVDVDGLLKELRILKHENMVTEKKIENIYTLIERLKKAEVLS